jgi:dynein heavy chain
MLAMKENFSIKLFLGVYFAKRLPIEVPREDCGCWIISGDLATRSIDQLSCLVDEIFVPLLSNAENHTGWPEMYVEMNS